MSTHHDEHEHHHHHENHAQGALRWGAGLTFGFAVAEAIGGWYTHSLALMGDAAHMFSDSAALIVAALAAQLSTRPPTLRHSYGLGRAEVVAAVLNGAIMLVIVVGIVASAIERLQTPHEVLGGSVAVVASAGLLVNIVIAWMLHRSEQTLNVRGALLHVLGDLLGSIAALIAGIVIFFTNWTMIDSLLSIAICVLIGLSAIRLLRDALHVIMEGVPAHLDMGEVGNAIARVPNVVSVHDLHIWTLSSGHIALSAHVVLPHMDYWHSVLPRINHLLRERFHIRHTTLQPECKTIVQHRAGDIPIAGHEV